MCIYVYIYIYIYIYVCMQALLVVRAAPHVLRDVGLGLEVDLHTDMDGLLVLKPKTTQ